MSKKKIAVVLASAALIASLVIGGTLAYLTDTDTVTNTFTIGDIQITLTEPGWSDLGVDGIANTSDDPGYELVPGDTRVKNPKVTAVEGDSWMRIKMEIVATDGSMDSTRVTKIMSTITGLNVGAGANQFTLVGAADSATRTYTYNSKLAEGATAQLFTGISIPTTFTRTDMLALGRYTIKLTAQAIQSDNLTQADGYLELGA